MIPQLDSIKPVAGARGTYVTIYGKNFTTATQVWYNMVQIPCKFLNSTTLQVQLYYSGYLLIINPAPGGGTSAALAFKCQNAYSITTQI